MPRASSLPDSAAGQPERLSLRATYASQAGWFSTMDAADRYTLVARSDVSGPAMFDYFNALNMVDPETAQGPGAKSKAVGTGPFIFGEWVQGDHLSLTRSPHYWRSGRAFFDSIVINVVRDVVAMGTRLEAGNLDGIRSPSLEDSFVMVIAPYPARMVFTDAWLA